MLCTTCSHLVSQVDDSPENVMYLTAPLQINSALVPAPPIEKRPTPPSQKRGAKAPATKGFKRRLVKGRCRMHSRSMVDSATTQKSTLAPISTLTTRSGRNSMLESPSPPQSQSPVTEQPIAVPKKRNVMAKATKDPIRVATLKRMNSTRHSMIESPSPPQTVSPTPTKEPLTTAPKRIPTISTLKRTESRSNSMIESPVPSHTPKPPAGAPSSRPRPKVPRPPAAPQHSSRSGRKLSLPKACISESPTGGVQPHEHAYA